MLSFLLLFLRLLLFFSRTHLLFFPLGLTFSRAHTLNHERSRVTAASWCSTYSVRVGDCSPISDVSSVVERAFCVLCGYIAHISKRRFFVALFLFLIYYYYTSKYSAVVRLLPAADDDDALIGAQYIGLNV